MYIKIYTHAEIIKLIHDDLNKRQDAGEFRAMGLPAEGFPIYTRTRFRTSEGATIFVSTTPPE